MMKLARLTKGLLVPLLACALGACQRAPESTTELVVPPGAEGTYVAIGADTSLDVASPDGRWSYSVRPAQTAGVSTGASNGTEVGGPHPQQQNEAMSFMPASTTKLLTSMMTLELLGPDWHLGTEASWRNAGAIASDLILVSDGDPQTDVGDEANGPGRDRLGELAARMHAAGITRLSGPVHLVSRDPRKDVAETISGVEDDDNTACYGALAQGFNYRRNCANVMVTGPSSAAWSATEARFPVRFDFAITTGAKRAVDVVPELDADGVVRSFLFKGIWSATGHSRPSFSLPVSGIKTWYGSAFLAACQKAGIDVSAATLDPIEGPDASRSWLSEAADTSRVRVAVHSDAIADLMVLMNKPSDNFLADTLFKAVASEAPGADLRTVGIDRLATSVTAWLQAASHPEWASEVKLFDGAGLSRSNRVTPRAYLALLKHFSEQPLFPVLWNSLPIAGRDGTLKNRMKGTIAEGVVRAKTGTLKGAYQLAGYIPRKDASGQITAYVPFVMLSSTTPANEAHVRAFQDQLVVSIMRALNH